MKRNNMREIKFRVWSNRRKRYLNNERDNPNDNSYHVEGNVNEQIYCIARFLGEHDGEEDAILEQYTGLKDKNGVEIYEGDIFEGSRNKWGAVEFKDGKFVVNLRGARLYDLCELFDDPWYRPEVIGNIHENPELLEK